MSRMMSTAMAAAVLAHAFGVEAQVVVIETVPVGNPVNAWELSGQGAGGYGPDRLCGRVTVAYNIGTFEVTARQYTEFLNAVAATDTYGLYNTSMWSYVHGCKIERSGSSGSYSYGVAEDWAARPVNFVSWGDAARFANWMHNGQPTAIQGSGTTEDGSYVLNGATSQAALLLIDRELDATWVIPSEDEWYKAAYHYNDGVTGNYYDYPTSSDGVPSNDLLEPDPGNNATFLKGFYPDNDYTIDSPYYRTEVGAHENSDSPYGTFDQGGNVWEWNEAILLGSYRGLRGGSFEYWVSDLLAADRNFDNPALENYDYGFRVAYRAACGDGVIEFGERCDDNNTDDGDGCSASCMVEPEFVCQGEPSACILVVIPAVSTIGLVVLVCGLMAAGGHFLRRLNPSLI